jgi:hypothetical protein
MRDAVAATGFLATDVADLRGRGDAVDDVLNRQDAKDAKRARGAHT